MTVIEVVKYVLHITFLLSYQQWIAQQLFFLNNAYYLLGHAYSKILYIELYITFISHNPWHGYMLYSYL